MKKPLEKASRDPEQQKKSKQTEDPLDQNTSSSYQQKGSIDYKSNKVNITNIVKDFNNTILAIGAPKDIEEEVKSYLNLVNVQSNKPKPSTNIIKSNLKNAAEILDTYITKTLNKSSKVVTNWIDALLLQEVDYKAPVSEANNNQIPLKEPDLTHNTFIGKEQPVNKPEEPKVAEAKVQKPAQKQPKLENIKLRNLYKQSEKLVDSGNYDKALEGYDKAFKLADKIGNTKVKAKISMDVAYIHDVNNNLPLALKNYNDAIGFAKTTGDKATQAKAHYNMGTIYDDVGKIDAALDHYYSALAFDGETENIKDQALTLNSIGNMFALKQDYKTSLTYYKLAFGLAKEQDDKAGQASILSNTAGVFRDLGYDKKALKFYGDAIKLDIDAGNAAGYAKSYEQAGDIMLNNGQNQKAQKLYGKSMQAGQQIGDRGWCARLMTKMEKLSV